MSGACRATAFPPPYVGEDRRGGRRMIRMRGIRKVYSTGRVEVTALKGVDLDVGANEYLAVVGPSGSGKSTLMNMLGCLDTPTSGEYILNGIPVSGMSDNALAEVRNKQIGFVFQNAKRRAKSQGHAGCGERWSGRPCEAQAQRTQRRSAAAGGYCPSLGKR